MATQFIDKQNITFLLFAVHGMSDLFEYKYFEEYDKESILMLLESAMDFSEKELKPYLEEMDRYGVEFKDSTVHVHPQIKKVLTSLGELGMLNATLSIAQGGMQLPYMAHYSASFIYTSANNAGIGYSMLTAGAANLIVSFGTDNLQRIYADKMYAGIWQGTMALTEPGAGSSLSDITTKAIGHPDGTYKLSGQKIFISGGDYADVENVIHLMLARIEGAPNGVKGISLFVVPKKRVEGDTLVNNDVVTAGVFHKLGQSGYVTTHLMIGENGDCAGYLIGEENKGLLYMFQMMNASRIEVGLTGTAIASAAYYASLEYANERIQGRHPDSKDPNGPPVKIIEHADIRRMLLHQKCFVEGTFSLILQCARYIDMTKVTEGNEKEKYELLLDILTPVVKAYPTEQGILSVSNGLQCLGGYGYCRDFPLEQLYRDIRITTLYEGTTGIQALDLLGRKFVAKEGKAAKYLLEEIMDTVTLAGKSKILDRYVSDYSKMLTEYKNVFGHLQGLAKKGDIKGYLADANLFLELTGLVLLGWQWLKQGIVVAKMIEEKENVEFMEGKLHALKYFFIYELPRSASLITTLLNNEQITIKGEKEFFQ